MQTERNDRGPDSGRRALPLWQSMLLLAIVTGAYWLTRDRLPPAAEHPAPEQKDPADQIDITVKPRGAGSQDNGKQDDGPHAEATWTVRDVVVRDRDGKVAWRGTVDLTKTIARIEAGQRLRFANDGAVFQNRERRLPRQNGGYYHEYVHPTPGLSGPGPQRVIFGADGEIYYTADHYHTFTTIRGP